MLISYPEMGVIITGIVAVVGLIIKFAPKKIDDDNCNQDECMRKFDQINKRVELNNTDVQLLKSNHNTQEKAIDGFREDIRKIFDKMDELKMIVLQSINK